MFATPLCPAPRQFIGPPKFAHANTIETSCPVRVRPFSYRIPTILHGRVRRDQVVYDAVDAALGCVFTEPTITVDLPRAAYSVGPIAPTFITIAHDWSLANVPGVNGSQPPANNGTQLVDRHHHLLFLSVAQLEQIAHGNTLVVATTTDPTNLVWTRGGETHQPAWLDSSAHPSQKWRKHVHVFAFRDAAWKSGTGILDWTEWGWGRRPGQPSG